MRRALLAFVSLLSVIATEAIAEDDFDYAPYKERERVVDYNNAAYMLEHNRRYAIQILDCSNADPEFYEALPESITPVSNYKELPEAFRGTDRDFKRAKKKLPLYVLKSVTSGYERECKVGGFGDDIKEFDRQYKSWKSYNSYMSSHIGYYGMIRRLIACNSEQDYDEEIEQLSSIMKAARIEDVPDDFMVANHEQREIWNDEVDDLYEEVRSKMRKCERQKRQ